MIRCEHGIVLENKLWVESMINEEKLIDFDERKPINKGRFKSCFRI